MRILITGGTGSLGSRLAKKWYAEGHQITILSRNPQKQSSLSKEIPGARFFLTDICNRDEVYKACLDQDILVHAAAIKQVDVGEYHPAEFTRVNVLGSQIIADAWSRSTKGSDRKALLISTDKAVNSLNSYGATKKLAEAIFRKHDFSVIRYGNVVESDGSFLQIWKDAIENNRPIKVRQPCPTRFFLTFSDAIQLIEETLQQLSNLSGIFVPNSLRSFSIEDVALYTGYPVQYEPLLPYEKIHEVLIAEGEYAIKISDSLSRVVPGWSVSVGNFNSNTAPRVKPKEFLEAIGWKL